MHPEKASAGPADCPVCGMKMVEVAASVGAIPESPGPSGAAGNKYVCSMDGGQRRDPGPCPKCGMRLDERDRVSPGGEGVTP